MAVQPHRTSWPDERLDDLNLMIREGFVRTEAEMARLRSEVSVRFDRVDNRLDNVNERFDSLQRVLIVGLFSVCGAILAAVIAGLIALA